MAGAIFAKIFTDCLLLRSSLEPLLPEMPHLSPEYGDLVEFLDIAGSLNARQQELTGELRRIVRLRQEAELRGLDLRSRVAFQLRGKLGFTNEQLLSFGLTPRRKPRRRETEEPEPAPEIPAPEVKSQ